MPVIVIMSVYHDSPFVNQYLTHVGLPGDDLIVHEITGALEGVAG